MDRKTFDQLVVKKARGRKPSKIVSCRIDKTLYDAVHAKGIDINKTFKAFLQRLAG